MKIRSGGGDTGAQKFHPPAAAAAWKEGRVGGGVRESKGGGAYVPDARLRLSTRAIAATVAARVRDVLYLLHPPATETRVRECGWFHDYFLKKNHLKIF